MRKGYPPFEQDRLHVFFHDHWITLLLFLFFGTIVWARNIHYRRFIRLGRSIINIREFYQAVREEYSISNSLSISLVALFILGFSLFLYQANLYFGYYHFVGLKWVFYLKIVSVVFAVFIYKLLTIRGLSVIFLGKLSAATDYLYNVYLTNAISGLILVPFTLFLAFLQIVSQRYLIQVSSVLLILIFLFRILRYFNIGRDESGVSKLYFFTYLCTIEIIPVLIGVKLVLELSALR